MSDVLRVVPNCKARTGWMVVFNGGTLTQLAQVHFGVWRKTWGGVVALRLRNVGKKHIVVRCSDGVAVSWRKEGWQC